MEGRDQGIREQKKWRKIRASRILSSDCRNNKLFSSESYSIFDEDILSTSTLLN